jgi:hypothetical protein
LEQHSGLKIGERLSRDFDLVGMEISGKVTVKALRRAYTHIEKTMQPASEDYLVQLLAKMQMMMKHRNLDDAHMDLMLMGYVEKLREFPADAVEDGLNSLLDSCEWFPAWAEMREAIAWRCQRRTMTLEAINREINKERMREINSASNG